MLARIIVWITLALPIVAGCTGGDSESKATLASTTAPAPSNATGAETCPVREEVVLELPDRMSAPQLAACVKRFHLGAPGTARFSASVCNDVAFGLGACNDVRRRVCDDAVRQGRFRDLRNCLYSAPPTRVVVLEQPRITLELRDPWVLGGDSYVTDGEVVRNGYISFYAVPLTAWDPTSESARAFPADLTGFLAEHRHIKVIARADVSIAEGSARRLDGVANRTGDLIAFQRGYCGETSTPNHCVPISADRTVEGNATITLSPGGTFRVLDIRARDRRVIVVIDNFSGAQQFLSEADTLLRTMRVE